MESSDSPDSRSPDTDTQCEDVFRALDFIQRQGLRYTLEEGDTLFVPAGWAHAVFGEPARNPDDDDGCFSIGFNQWFPTHEHVPE